MPSKESFADRYIAAARNVGHPLCVGLDPHLDLIPTSFGAGRRADSTETVDAVGHMMRLIVQECIGSVAAVKPQVAFYEQMGWRGMRLLEELIREARSGGLLVILDAKRGDIGSTAEAYACAFLREGAPFQVDALTVNPYLGMEALTPFVNHASESGAGLFVLAKTSNPGAGQFQDLELKGSTATVAGVVAEFIERRGDALRGRSGWSGLGAVVGATYPEEAAMLRQVMPNSLFLVPGYGAQGGVARDAFRSFVRGKDGLLEGGVINSARAILFGAERNESRREWFAGFRQRLSLAVESLSKLVRETTPSA